jgi:hypothetical protein
VDGMRKQEMMSDDESGLDQFFQHYRQSFPDMEPSVNFMPMLWQKIEARHSFPFIFRRLGRSVMTASAALCLLLLALNLATTPQMSASYADALIAEGSAEQTYYTEAIVSTSSPEGVPSSPRR